MVIAMGFSMFFFTTRLRLLTKRHLHRQFDSLVHRPHFWRNPQDQLSRKGWYNVGPPNDSVQLVYNWVYYGVDIIVYGIYKLTYITIGGPRL